MEILFLLLKILGILLLIVLLLFFCILFLPIGYHGRAVWNQEKKQVKIRGSWLWIFLRVSFVYFKDYNVLGIRILGLPIYSSDPKKRSLLGGKDDPESTKKEKKVKKKKKSKESEQTEDETVSSTENQDDIPADQTEQYEIGDDWDEIKEDQKDDQKKDPFIKKIVDFLKKCYNSFRSLMEKLKEIRQKADSVLDLLHDDKIIAAAKRVAGYGWKACRQVLPRKISGKMKMGLNDPSTTGQIFGFICMAQPYYKKRFQVTPDFTQKVLEADVSLSGRVYVFRLLWLAWKIYRDKDLMKQKERIQSTLGGF